MPITKYIKGNVLDHPHQIAHGVNCQGVMGSGVAAAIRAAHPQHFEDYKLFVQSRIKVGYKSSALLGSVVGTEVEDHSNKIIGMFTQDFFGNDGKRYVNYHAIGKAIENVYFNLMWDDGASILPLGIPKIGAGFGGGDWNFIEQIINDASPFFEIWVYEI